MVSIKLFILFINKRISLLYADVIQITIEI